MKTFLHFISQVNKKCDTFLKLCKRFKNDYFTSLLNSKAEKSIFKIYTGHSAIKHKAKNINLFKKSN